MSVINVSRRQFLGGVFSTGALVLASRVLPESAWAQTPSPTDQDIHRAMAGNICRCGTYQRIRSAIRRAAEIKRGA